MALASLLVLPLLASALPAEGRTMTAVAASPSDRSATQVVHVRPTDRRGVKLPQYRVVRLLRDAQCQPGSQAVIGAFRCFARHDVLDPCWLERDREHFQALCLGDPWSDQLTRLRISTFGGYPPYKGGTYPWGLRLANGSRCLTVQGAGGVFHGRRVQYGCRHNVYVLDGLHRDRRVWRGDTVTYDKSAGKFRNGPTRKIAKAFIGLKSWQPGHD